MSNEKKIVEGLVIEALPNLQYKVQLADGKEIICYTAGKVKLHKIRIYIGDRVRVELDPYHGKATNRLIFRL